MINIKKALSALNQRLCALEVELEKIKALLNAKASNASDSSDTTSYKEVIDEWLNGKQL